MVNLLLTIKFFYCVIFGLQDLLSENELKLIFGNRSKWISKKTLSNDNYDDEEDRGDLYDFFDKRTINSRFVLQTISE